MIKFGSVEQRRKDMSDEKEWKVKCAFLESRLKEAETKIADDDWRWKEYFGAGKNLLKEQQDKIQSLEQRLSQAEAENKRLKQKEKDLYASQCNWIDRSVLLEKELEEYKKAEDPDDVSVIKSMLECIGENRFLQKRLSHLMDVAERMGMALEQVVKCPIHSVMSCCCQRYSEAARAEWDGIKEKK